MDGDEGALATLGVVSFENNDFDALATVFMLAAKDATEIGELREYMHYANVARAIAQGLIQVGELEGRTI